MKRLKKLPEATPPEGTEAFDLEGIYSGSELSPALASAMAELGIEDEGTIKIYVSQLLEDGREARIWEGPPTDYDLAGLAKRFGSGDYRVKLYAPMESGKMVKRGQRDFPMRLEAGEDAALEAKRRPNFQTAQPAGGVLTAEAIAKAVADGIRAAIPAQPPAPDMMALFSKMGEIFKSLIPPAPTIAPASSLGGFQEAIKMVQGFIETSRALAPAMPLKDGEPDVGGLALARGVDLFAKMFEKSIDGKNGAVVPGVNQPAQGSGADEMSAEDLEMLQMWKLQLKAANRSAAAGVKPEDFAETVYPMVPDTVIEGMATDENWFKLLCANVPECTPHEKWYFAVREKLMALALEDGILTQAPEKPNMPDGADSTPTKPDAK